MRVYHADLLLTPNERTLNQWAPPADNPTSRYRIGGSQIVYMDVLLEAS
jgi:hypothetical protein